MGKKVQTYQNGIKIKKTSKKRKIETVYMLINDFTLTNIILIVSSLMIFIIGVGYGAFLNKMKDEYNEE